MASEQPRSRLISGAYTLVAALAVALFGLGIRPYLLAGFADDDAFISLRYAQRLAEGQGLSWNDGEWVEGYSNLLWVLSEAALAWVGVDAFASLRVLGFAGTGLALLALGWSLRPGRTGSLIPGSFAMLAFVSLQPVIIATASGFETPYVIGFLAAALALLSPTLAKPDASRLRPYLLAGVPLGLLCLTRPDGPLFTAVAGLTLLALGGPWRLRVQRMLALGALPVAATLGQLAFRLWRYGDWVPNTARVKLPGGLDRASEGLDYVIEGLQYQRGLWLFALLALAALVPRLGASVAMRRRVLLLLALFATWTAYVVYSGGVWLLGRRFLVASLLLLCWLAGLGLCWLLGWARGRSHGRLAPVVMLLVAGVSLGWLRSEQWRDPQINRAVHYSFHWKKKGIELAEIWGQAFAQRGTPYLAVDTAGAIPFYTGWPALDMLGLMDRHIAMNPPGDPAWILSGHTHGDGAYTIDRAPDIVLFGVHWGTWGGVFTGGQQMHADPRFYERYRYVELQRAVPPSAIIRVWLRLESPVLGIERRDDAIRVPAWFVSGEGCSHHMLSGGELRLPLAAGDQASATGILVPAGRWRITPRWHGRAPVRASLSIGLDGASPVEDGPVPRDLVLPDDVALDLHLGVLEAPPDGAMLEALDLERLPDLMLRPMMGP
jgi:arabinofuranosyltransferase